MTAGRARRVFTVRQRPGRSAPIKSHTPEEITLNREFAPSVGRNPRQRRGDGCIDRGEQITMSGIVTDVERPDSHSTPRSGRSSRLLRRVSLPIASVAIASSCCLLPLARTAGADTLSAEKAKAAQIQQQIQSTGQQI